MKARLILNEIKRGTDKSELGSIGVGKEAIFKGYRYLTTLAPGAESLHYNLDKDESFYGDIDICFNKISKFFECDVKDFLVVKDNLLKGLGDIDYILYNFFVETPDNPIKEMTGRIFTYDNRIINYTISLSENWKAAKLSLKPSFKNKQIYYFVQHK